jgi:hypothetical protein
LTVGQLLVATLGMCVFRQPVLTRTAPSSPLKKGVGKVMRMLRGKYAGKYADMDFAKASAGGAGVLDGAGDGGLYLVLRHLLRRGGVTVDDRHEGGRPSAWYASIMPRQSAMESGSNQTRQ